MSARQRPNKDLKKDLSVGFLQQTYFCLPSISGAPGCGPGLVRGTRLSACRICCLFTISNIRAHPRRGEANLIDTSNHHPSLKEQWWSLSGSNRRPEACKATALPAELRPLVAKNNAIMVGLGRLERPTSPLSGVRSNHLSYRPELRPTLQGPKTPAAPERCIRNEIRETKTAASRIMSSD